MYLTEIRKIDSLDNIYVRSFTIIEDEIYFVSANGNIIRADLQSFEILDTYPVPDTIAGMIQLTKIEDYFYLTVSTDINGSQDGIGTSPRSWSSMHRRCPSFHHK